MTSLIAAAPGTLLIDSGGHTVAVIVGWQYLQGNMVFPVFAHAFKGVKEYHAIYHYNGYVEHPATGKFFESTAQWTDWADRTLGEDPVKEAAPVPGTGPDMSPLKFGTKSNKTKSFFSWPTANAIFEIEGEAALPEDPRVIKIKRDEFADLKRNGAVKIDPHVGIIVEDEPVSQAAPEAEEDDMDVV